VRRFYDDEGMNFAVLMGLGFVYHGIADAGETLATIERVPEGDRDACEPAAQALRDERVFDWLEETLEPAQSAGG